MSEDEAHALLEVALGPPDAAVTRSLHAMQCASLLRETMWSLVSELHLDAPGADYETLPQRTSPVWMRLSTSTIRPTERHHHDTSLTGPRSSSSAAASSVARRPIIWPAITRQMWFFWNRAN
jgi:hypothetical protein